MRPSTWADSGRVRTEDVAWLRVEDESSPGTVRRRALDLGDQVGLDERRLAEVAIVATELSTNLVKYATEGAMVLRLLRQGTEGGVELVAVDRGPGVRDVGLLFADGESSSGTLGIGLGAVRRLSTSFDAHSVPGRGTVIAVTLWQDGHATSPVTGLTRPVQGETECGDAYSVRCTPHGHLVMLVDGLGHGPLAARAAAEAVRLFEDSTETSPALVLQRLHRGMSATRGAAVAIAHLDLTAAGLTYAGVGNIAGRALGATGRGRGLMSHPGIVGHRFPAVRDLVYPVDPASTVVMHSDGISEKWDLVDYPGLAGRSPLVVATTLMRDAAVRRDDASVVVARGAVP